MNIKRMIDKNGKLIFYVVLIIIFILFIIKSLNSYYEKDEQRKKEELDKNITNSQSVEKLEITENDYTEESNSLEITIASFVKYCNNREIESAYKMLTDECKKAMFPTKEFFEEVYVSNIFKVKRTYDLVKWSTDGNKTTFLVKFYGDILATGGIKNYTEEFYTFIKNDDGIYKLNINNYIYGEERNIESTVRGITIKIGQVDVYEEYERVLLTIQNNTSKTISLTGNQYGNNIYLLNSQNTKYSSLNSKFDEEEIVMGPGGMQTIWVEFNKVYSSTNKAVYLVLNDVILDYEDYLKSEDKKNYSNKTSIKVQYQK